MINFKAKAKVEALWLIAQIKKKKIERLSRAAFLVRGVAQRSLRTAKGPSPAGSPPHTHRRRRLSTAILYATDRNRGYAVIGPAVHMVGRSGAAHEKGGKYKRQRYPRRPFMGPALEQVRPHLPRMWRAMVR